MGLLGKMLNLVGPYSTDIDQTPSNLTNVPSNPYQWSVVRSFRHWRFPTELPQEWKVMSAALIVPHIPANCSVQDAVHIRDAPSRITNHRYSEQVAPLGPMAESHWFDANDMIRFHEEDRRPPFSVERAENLTKKLFTVTKSTSKQKTDTKNIEKIEQVPKTLRRSCRHCNDSHWNSDCSDKSKNEKKVLFLDDDVNDDSSVFSLNDDDFQILNNVFFDSESENYSSIDDDETTVGTVCLQIVIVPWLIHGNMGVPSQLVVYITR
jgi:hypothetical protein